RGARASTRSLSSCRASPVRTRCPSPRAAAEASEHDGSERAPIRTRARSGTGRLDVRRILAYDSHGEPRPDAGRVAGRPRLGRMWAPVIAGFFRLSRRAAGGSHLASSVFVRQSSSFTVRSRALHALLPVNLGGASMPCAVLLLDHDASFATEVL